MHTARRLPGRRASFWPSIAAESIAQDLPPKGGSCGDDSLMAQALRDRSNRTSERLGHAPGQDVPGPSACEAIRRSLRKAETMPEPTSTTTAIPVGLPDFGAGASAGAPGAIGLLSDVQLQVRIELGRTKMLVEDVLRLNADSVVELDKAAGDPVDIYVNGRRIARGEVLVLNENFCVRVSEIIEPIDG
jgi:flagellar motor switch protein FliN/FliY